MILFKFLDPGLQPRDGGRETWPAPGTWAPELPIQPFFSGYHLARWSDLFAWVGPCLFTAEGEGDHWADDKTIIFRRARLLRPLNFTPKVAQDFAAEMKATGDHLAALAADAVTRPGASRAFRASAFIAKQKSGGGLWRLWDYAIRFLRLAGITEAEINQLVEVPKCSPMIKRTGRRTRPSARPAQNVTRP